MEITQEERIEIKEGPIKRCQYCRNKLIYIKNRGGIIPHLWRCETCNRDIGIPTKKSDRDFAKFMCASL